MSLNFSSIRPTYKGYFILHGRPEAYAPLSPANVPFWVAFSWRPTDHRDRSVKISMILP